MLLNSMTDTDRIEEYEGCDDGSNGNGGAGFRSLGRKRKAQIPGPWLELLSQKNQTRRMKREIQKNCGK